MLVFGQKFAWGIALSLLVLGVTIGMNNEDPGGGFATGALVVVGGLIGVLFAPSPKPVDHSARANTAVERLMDMTHEIESVQDTVTDLITVVEDVTVRMRLVEAQNVLLKQQERMQRSVSDWNDVSPGVGPAVRLRLDEGKRQFMELVERNAE